MSERNIARASFLKSRRRRLTPEQVGLPKRSHGRVDTLRREDVAWLADVGITWYTWLEQGRPIKVAQQTLGRIGAALHLDSSELEYLSKLVHGPRDESSPWDAPLDPSVRMLVETYGNGYAIVVGPRWDILAANPALSELLGFGETSADGTPSLEDNGLWQIFTKKRVQQLFPDWEAVARGMVATFRLEQADYAGEPAFTSLIDHLTAGTSAFAAMWGEFEVLLPSRWHIGRIWDGSTNRFVEHETISLCVPGAPGQTVRFYVPTACDRELAVAKP